MCIRDSSREHFLNALKALELLGVEATSQENEKDCNTIKDCKKLLNKRLAEIFQANDG